MITKRPKAYTYTHIDEKFRHRHRPCPCRVVSPPLSPPSLSDEIVRLRERGQDTTTIRPLPFSSLSSAHSHPTTRAVLSLVPSPSPVHVHSLPPSPACSRPCRGNDTTHALRPRSHGLHRPLCARSWPFARSTTRTTRHSTTSRRRDDEHDNGDTTTRRCGARYRRAAVTTSSIPSSHRTLDVVVSLMLHPPLNCPSHVDWFTIAYYRPADILDDISTRTLRCSPMHARTACSCGF